jgi:hypothetical protein
MRVKEKIDYVSLALRELSPLFLGLLISVDLPFLISHHQLRYEHFPFHLEFCLLPLMFCYLSLRFCANYPHYFEFREDGLFVRQGWNGNLVPYDSFDKVLPITHLYKNSSTKRILVISKSGKTFVVALPEGESFVAEVSSRCPQLELRETEYGFSLQQAIL